MKVAGSIALVTGANRGLGLAFARALLERGAAKVYAAARNPEAVTLKGVVPLKLDVTSDEDAVAAARAAGTSTCLSTMLASQDLAAFSPMGLSRPRESSLK